MLHDVEHVVMVVPIDAEVHEAQHVGEEDRAQVLEVGPMRALDAIDDLWDLGRSRTMIVMMMAMTASLNASRRDLVTP